MDPNPRLKGIVRADHSQRRGSESGIEPDGYWEIVTKGKVGEVDSQWDWMIEHDYRKGQE